MGGNQLPAVCSILHECVCMRVTRRGDLSQLALNYTDKPYSSGEQD